MQEFNTIFDIIKKSKKGFRILKKLGTAENMVSTFSKLPMILHISCHGIETTTD